MKDTHRAAKNIERTAATKAAKAAGPVTPTGRHRARTTRRHPATTIATAATAALTAAVAWVALTATNHQPELIADAAALPTTEQTVVNAKALDFVADLTVHGIPTTGHGAHLVQMAERTCDHLTRHGINHEQLAPTMKVYFADLRWTDRQALDYVLASHRYCETLTGAPPAVHTGHGT